MKLADILQKSCFASVCSLQNLVHLWRPLRCFSPFFPITCQIRMGGRTSESLHAIFSFFFKKGKVVNIKVSSFFGTRCSSFVWILVKYTWMRRSPVIPHRLLRVGLSNFLTAYGAQPKKMPESTFLRNGWRLAWSVANIGWCSTFAPNSMIRPPKCSCTRRSSGVFPPDERSWTLR